MIAHFVILVLWVQGGQQLEHIADETQALAGIDTGNPQKFKCMGCAQIKYSYNNYLSTPLPLLAREGNRTPHSPS